MDKNTLRMAVSAHWSQIIRPLYAQAYDAYNEDQYVPQALQLPNLPDLLTNDLQSVGVDDFINDSHVNNTDANYLDNLNEWAKENYPLDYLYSMVAVEYERSGLKEKADDMLLDRIIDDPSYGELNDRSFWAEHIAMSPLNDVLHALKGDDLTEWVERYADNWREQRENGDKDN